MHKIKCINYAAVLHTKKQHTILLKTLQQTLPLISCQCRHIYEQDTIACTYLMK